jgi:hypothetical protein
MFLTSCHCGAVKLEVRGMVTEYTDCNCSLCRRYGALWGYFVPEDVKITGVDQLESYQWGDRTIRLNRCTVCGCVMHWSPNVPNRPKLGINLRLADPDLLEAATPRMFDGACTKKYLNP